MMKDQRFWAAIRRVPEGDEFVDIRSLSSLRDGAKWNVAELSLEIPTWHKDNPVQRIVIVTITEGEL